MGLIDADALKIAIDDGWTPDMRVSEIWGVIDEVPTVATKQDIEAHWIIGPNCDAVCTRCGNYGKVGMKYCGYCGSKMTRFELAKRY